MAGQGRGQHISAIALEMADQKPPPPLSARDSDTSWASTEESSPTLSQVSKESLSRIVIQTMDHFQENDSQIISEIFPEAKDFLKERLALSIEKRRNRFLDRRPQHGGARTSSNKPKSLVELESRNFAENPGSESSSAKSAEAQRWKIKECFPKELKIDGSQSHFVCHICFCSMPSEEAKGDLWM